MGVRPGSPRGKCSNLWVVVLEQWCLRLEVFPRTQCNRENKTDKRFCTSEKVKGVERGTEREGEGRRLGGKRRNYVKGIIQRKERFVLNRSSVYHF